MRPAARRPRLAVVVAVAPLLTAELAAALDCDDLIEQREDAALLDPPLECWTLPSWDCDYYYVFHTRNFYPCELHYVNGGMH